MWSSDLDEQDLEIDLASFEPARDAVEVEGMVAPDFKQKILTDLKVFTHMPHATVHSSLVAEAWLAWHSMHRSMMWFLGIILNSILMGTLYIVKRVCVCVW